MQNNKELLLKQKSESYQKEDKEITILTEKLNTLNEGLDKEILKEIIELKKLEKEIYNKKQSFYLEWCNITNCECCISYKLFKKCIRPDFIDPFFEEEIDY